MDIAKKFRNLVQKYGKDGVLHTFEICTNKGTDLAGSTIDKITLVGTDNVAFYYDENTNDFDTIGAFAPRELESFYKDLKNILG